MAYDGSVTYNTKIDTKELEAGLKRMEKSMTDYAKKLENAYEKMGNAQTTAIEKAWKESEHKSDTSSKKIKEDIDGIGKESKETANDIKGIGNEAEKLERMVSTAAKAAGAAIAVGAGAVVKIGMDFDAGMSRVQAIAGATDDELETLTNQAKDLGAKTAFSASEASAGMENLASAGFNVNEMISAMPGLLGLAAVSGGDVGAASEVAASSLRAFGLDAGQAAHVADVFARAAADTNAEALDMGEAMKYVAPMAHSAGISLEETAAAVGIMSDAGIKGSQAGTTLRAALARIAGDKTAVSKALDGMGISFYDLKGNMIPLKDQIKLLQSRFKDMTQEQKNNVLVNLYGQEALSGMMALIDKGPDKLDTLTKSLENSDGSAAEMAKTMQDNLKGDIEQLGGAAETLGLQIYDGIEQPLRDAASKGADKISELADSFKNGELQPALENTGKLLGNIVSGATDLATDAIPPLTAGLGFISNNLGLLVTVGGMAIAGMTAYTVSVGIATKAQLAWNAAQLVTHPVGLAIAGVAALGVAVYGIAKACENAENAYWNMGDEIAATGAKFEEAKNKSKLTDDYAAEWNELRDAIDNNKVPAENLAAAQQRVKDIEAWFIDNYGNYISAEEKKNGMRKDTIEKLQEQSEKLSEIARLELESSLLEKKSKIPELSTKVNKLSDRNKELEEQRKQALEASIALRLMDEEWQKFIEKDPSEEERLKFYDDACKKVTELTGGKYDISGSGLAGLSSVYEGCAKDAENMAKSIEKNNTKMEDGTESLTQYASEAKRVIEYKLGDTYENAAAKMSLLQKAQSELNQSGSISEDTMNGLIEKFPDLEAAKDKPAAVTEKMQELSQKIEDARTSAQNFGTDLNGIPTDINVNVRLNVFGEEKLQNIPHNARGTSFAKQGLSVVNERGTELIEGQDGSFRYVSSNGSALTLLNRGDKVYTAAQSRNMLRSSEKKIPGFASGLNSGYSMPSVAKFAISGQVKTKLGGIGKEIVQSMADGIMKNDELVTRALNELGEEMLDSEKEYLAEKTRIEDERARADEEKRATDYRKRLSEAKNQTERMELEQEERLRIQKVADDARLEELKKTADNEKSIMDALKNDIKATYSAIADYATEHIGEVTAAQERLSSKLEDFGSMTYTVDLGSTGSYEMLSDLGQHKQYLTDYNELMKDVKERIARLGFASEDISDFMTRLADMTPNDAMKTARAISVANDETFSKYIQDIKDIKALVGQSSAEFYKDDMETAVNESIDYMEQELKKMGFTDIPPGFFTSGTVSAQKFGEGFVSELESVFEDVRAMVSTFNASLAPQLSYAGAGGGNTSYSDTYNIYGGNSDLTQQIEDINKRKRMLGK